MQKLLISITAAASLIVSGCGTIGEGLDSAASITEVIPRALDKAPLIYRPTIQQGNVITQEQVNKLKPGMSRRQVRFVLGSPTLQDIFHDDRWDYPYTTGVGSTPDDMKYLTVYFDNDRLVRVSGDWQPQPLAEQPQVEKAAVVSVPDWEGDSKTLWGRTLETVGLGSDD